MLSHRALLGTGGRLIAKPTERNTSNSLNHNTCQLKVNHFKRLLLIVNKGTIKSIAYSLEIVLERNPKSCLPPAKSRSAGKAFH